MNVGRGSRTGIVRFENESSRAKGAKEREWRNEEDRGWKRERERERERQTGLKGEGRSFEDGDMELVRDERGSETGHSCFIGPLRLPPRRWREEGGRRWNRLYTRRRRKTRMRLMIYMGATVYYPSIPSAATLSPSLASSPSPLLIPSPPLSRSIQYVSFSEAPRFFRSSRVNNVYVCIYYP